MCGIAGFLDRSGLSRPAEMEAVVGAMTRTLAHRGPDGGDRWVDAAGGVALGHRRLAIIDLTPAGRQPMPSGDGRYVITFNGEIYNFTELRQELEGLGHRFRGSSDTEVMLEGFSAWGVEATVRRLVGIFAFAVWDRAARRLTLARDHLGVKPLYHGTFGPLLVFGSELKALVAHPAVPRRVDRGSVAAFLRLGYVPTPFSVYEGIAKLPPGHLLEVDSDGRQRLLRYWDVAAVARAGLAARDTMDEAEGMERLEALLTDAVRRQMVSDVPLGAFLSGGVDSSLVTAVMQEHSGRPVRTFSIGFTEKAQDEAPFAADVARHLGTEHEALYVSPADLAAAVPRMPFVFDEPFADASQIATLLLSEMTRDHVTVALSGDGGDELFAGYGHYRLLDRLWGTVARVPAGVQRAFAGGVERLPAGVMGLADRLMPERPGRIPPHHRLLRTAQLLPAGTADDLYRRRYSHWMEPGSLLTGGAAEQRGAFWDDHGDAVPGFVERMQLLDQTTYLVDDVLPKVDRASMAVGLEARVPLLDHRLAELAWSLPPSLTRRGGTGKWALREILYRRVPRALVDRPKNGFNPPVDAWMRGPLRDWAEALMAPERLRAGGVLDPARVRPVWDAFQRGAGRPWDHKRLWDIVMLQAWLDTERTAVAEPARLARVG